MRICLSWGSIGVSANQIDAITLADRYGFEAVEASTDFVAKLEQPKLESLLADLKEKKLTWGAAGLNVEFRQDEAKFQEGIKKFASTAAGLQRAQVTRVGTWLMPADSKQTYFENFKTHSRRLREVATILKDHGQRLGLEYVGTSTLRTIGRYPFVHCLTELKELISAIGTGNVGVVLDSWHWWQAEDTVQDILSLRNEDVISVDLNDAPANVQKDRQVDGRRELPMATGVINVAEFLNALNKIGYDGPIRAEPFNKPLNDLGNDEACAATIESMRKAMKLIKS